MKIGISNFKGAIPGVKARLLPDDHGTVAENVRLDDGGLTPVRLGKRVHTFGAAAESFVRHENGGWMGFPVAVNAVKGAVDRNRLYVTGNGAPRIWLTDTTSIALRITPPASAPGASVVSGAVDPDLSSESVYAYTFITSLGEETPPSPASDLVEWSPGNTIRLTGLPSVNPNPARLLTGMRIYRSVTDSLGNTSYYFRAEIGFQATYDDVTSADASVADTAEEIPSLDYDAPPVDMQGIISMPNGMMAAFSGQELLFCEPYIHHAWPIKYRLKVNARIVGLGAFGSSVVILTEETPWVAQGTHPDSMVMEQIEVNLPCIAPRGIVDMGYSVIYPSTDGLVQVSNQGASVISMQMFPRETWAAMNPETMIGATMRGRYIFSYLPDPAPGFDEAATFRRLGIVDVSGAQPYFISDDSRFSHLMTETKTGSVFGLFDGDAVVRWDDLNEQRKRMRWRSKEIQIPTPTNFGVVRVDGDDDAHGDLICRVFAGRGSKQRLVREVRGRDRVERLPSGFTEEVWQIEVEGTLSVSAIFLAHSPSELAAG